MYFLRGERAVIYHQRPRLYATDGSEGKCDELVDVSKRDESLMRKCDHSEQNLSLFVTSICFNIALHSDLTHPLAYHMRRATEMRILQAVTSIFAVATVVVSSPVATFTNFDGTCGYVIDDATNKHILENGGWHGPQNIGTEHKGQYAMAETFHVDGGCVCNFYR